MKRMKRLSVVLVVLLLTVITACMALARVLGRPPSLPFDDRYLPGRPIPDLPATCYWEEYGYGYNTCVVIRTPAIYYDRNLNTNTIEDVLYDTPHIMIGDLVKVWGNPIGADYWHFGSEVYWPNGYAAWMFDDWLSPESMVYFVEVDPIMTPQGPWRGFRNSAPTQVYLPGMPTP